MGGIGRRPDRDGGSGHGRDDRCDYERTAGSGHRRRGSGALAGVLVSRNQDVILPPGTHVEMVLDRDLVFHPDELPGNPRFR